MRIKALHITLLIVLIGTLIRLFTLEFWKDGNHIRGDGLAYYTYLPAVVIHHDPTNTFYGDLDYWERFKYWLYPGKDGTYLPKMTMGIAFAWFPGYFIAHGVAGILDYPQDGWSPPYKWSVAISGILALLLGVFFLFKVLQRRYSGFISAVTVLSLVFATHLLHYAASEMSMSHVYTFALVAAFLDQNDRWMRNNRGLNLCLMALLLGWITLIRPTNIIVVLVPLIYLANQKVLLNRILNWKTLIAASLFFVPILPQLFFWKATTDQWVYYSYTEEAFYWLNPQIVKGLFSYRNGWLLYTPLFFLAIAGLFPLYRRDRSASFAFASILVIHVYITFSWWCWYYGDSLSIRPMVDMYAVFALGLAAFLNWVGRKAWWSVITTFVVLVLMVYSNYVQIKHYNTTVLTGSTMSKETFFALFMRSEAPSHLELTRAYRMADTDRLRKGLPERTEYDTTFIANLMDFEREEAEIIDPSNNFGKAMRMQDSILITNQNEFLRVSYNIKPVNPSESKTHLVFAFKEGDDTRFYKAIRIKDLDLEDGEWTSPVFYLRTPGGVSKDVKFESYVWNEGKSTTAFKAFKMDKIRVEYSEPL